jgi:hypothetical protein
MDLQTITTYFRRIKDDPKRLFQVIFSPCARGLLLNSFKEPTEYNFVNDLSLIPEKKFKSYLNEIKNDTQFLDYLERKHMQIRKKPLSKPQGWTELLYVLIRHVKPKIILETGVFDGVSSSFILKALKKNKYGNLVSVDRPAYQEIQGSTNFMPFHLLPPRKEPGWLVPVNLLKRWKLYKIKNTRGLKKIISKMGKIDIFFHDSLHTYGHMTWEMTLAWKKLKKNGLFFVDDIFCNDAFAVFCKNKKRAKLFKYGLGAIKK